MEDNLCEVCQVPAKQACSSCHASFYCSKECQRRAWKKHKDSCIPYVIQVHPVYGRYPKATRDIEAGEIVMRDTPLVLGPRVHSKPLCLGCHRAVTGAYTCSKCNFPLCSSTCEKSIFHEAECHVFSRAKNMTHIVNLNQPNPAYECILPLRCLLTKYTDPKKWKVLIKLQDSVDLTTQEWKKRTQINVIDYFNNFLNFKGIDKEDIYRICGILQINGFEVKTNGETIEGLFPKMSMMAHDCSPNTENVLSNMQVTVRSTVPIPKGAAITTSYTNLLWSTLQRRKDLLISKFFECTCQRCSDPTEFGTHFGTLLCSQCGGQVLSSAPLNNDAIWCCRDCNYSIACTDVERNYELLHQSFLERDRSQVRPLEDLIQLCNNKLLHPSHQIPLEAKYAWIKFCGNHPQYRYKDLSKVQLQTKISYCREFLKVADAIFPGRSDFRGFVLYELHASLKTLAQKLPSFGDLNNESIQDYMEEAAERLKETKSIFCFENEMEEKGFEDKLTLLTEEFEALR